MPKKYFLHTYLHFSSKEILLQTNNENQAYILFTFTFTVCG